MFGTQYYFCSVFCIENWIVVRVKLTMRFLWRCNFAIWLCSQDVIVGMYVVFLYILVFAFCMFKTVKVSVTAKRDWGDVNLLSRVGFLAYVKKNVFVLQASQRHDQDSWCRMFCDHNTSTRLLRKQLVMVALLVLHFSYMRQVRF